MAVKGAHRWRWEPVASRRMLKLIDFSTWKTCPAFRGTVLGVEVTEMI